MFEAILVDERRHELYTLELLRELAGGERAARAALCRAAIWEAWRTWRRAGRFVAQAVYGVTMVVLYLSFAPFALLLGAIRCPRAGWRRESLAGVAPSTLRAAADGGVLRAAPSAS